jgi:hypothetical protein
MLIIASLVVMGFGFLCIFDREFVWNLIETDFRLFWGKWLRRSKNWELLLIQQGSALILLGGIGLLVGIRMI